MRQGMFTRGSDIDGWRKAAGSGLWRSEPDWAAWEEPSGLTCAIQRNGYGTWCGYVWVDHHPLRSGSLDRGEPVWLDVHGGVTWHGRMTVPEAGLDGVAVGFDCNHAYDLAPRYAQEEGFMRRGTYRTMEFAIGETRSLAQQIAAYAPLQQLISGTEEEAE